MNAREFARDPRTALMLAWIVFAVGFYLIMWALWNGEDWAVNATYIPYDGSIVIATVIVLMVVKFYGVKGFEGRVWLLLGIGMALWLSAELVSGFDQLAMALGSDGLSDEAFKVTDYLFLVGYVFVVLAFAYKAMYAKLAFDTRKIAIAAVVVLAFAIPAGIWVAGPTMDSEDLSGFQKFVNLAYVALDIVLLGLGAIITLYWGAQVSKGWHIISAAILLMTVADIGYAALDWQGIYFDGNFIELAWIASYLLFGLGALYQMRIHQEFM
ncbi:MAG: hypothetical protein V1934_02900 [Methanobacteriota archaeon]